MVLGPEKIQTKANFNKKCGKRGELLDSLNSSTCFSLVSIVLGCLALAPLPLATPSCNGVKSELLCSVFSRCASVMMAPPGRELLSSFAFPMETLPYRVSWRMKWLLWLLAATMSSSKLTRKSQVMLLVCRESRASVCRDAVAQCILQVRLPWHPWLYPLNSKMYVEVGCK